MGGHFRFRSDSNALLDLVDAAYGRHAPHRFPQGAPELDVELHLLPRQAATWREPPPVRTRLDGPVLYGVLDDRNHVLVSPAQRRARVVASAELLDFPYHLRYELIEFAVFLLAARCQGLVPLHAACVGRNRRGILLLGQSGAGKSTLALHGLLQGLDLLAEDAVFVQPDGMLATGVASFLHVHADALDDVGDMAARRWIAGSPVIRRRSGVEKFEADLRHAPGSVRLAPSPLRLVATVVLTGRDSGQPGAVLAPVAGKDIAGCLGSDQAHGRTQPGWDRFEQQAAQLPVQYLHRGRHPGSAVDAIRHLLG